MTRATGYYRQATIYEDSIVFVCEDDLWSVSAGGGIARRLTAGQGACSFPQSSPDGSQVAFVAREEGDAEVYVMDADGGPARRITFLGGTLCMVLGWSSDGLRIVLASNAKSHAAGTTELFEVDAGGGMPRPLNIGHAVSISAHKNGAIVIGRNNSDPARWKRYRGGMAGELWVDQKGRGNFQRLLTELKGNLASPMWLNGRIYFLSDHEGIGNIYSCTADGGGLRRHTHHEEYYVRHPTTDGKRIVYTSGADIWVLDPAHDQSRRLEVQVASAPRHSRRKFMNAASSIEHVSIHPQGHSLGLISRGQPFTFPFWEEAVIQHGVGSKCRYRLLAWLASGARFVVVNDVCGFERIELHAADQSVKPTYVTAKDIGRVVSLVVSPTADVLAVSNHRHELLLVDVDKKKTRVLDRAPAERIERMSWSPDGRWIAYSYSPYPGASNLRIYDTKENRAHDVTTPIRADFCPSFDPDGNYLYFLSSRDFNPVYDSINFDLGFPFAVRPHLLTLRADVPSPFVPVIRSLQGVVPATAGSAQPGTACAAQGADGKEETKKKKDTAAALSKDARTAGKSTAKGKKEPPTKASTTEQKSDAAPPAEPAAKPVVIEFEGIHDRVLSFPVEEGKYTQIAGLPGRAVYTKMSVRGIKRSHKWWNEQEEGGTLLVYDIKEQRSGSLFANVSGFALGRDNRTMVYSSNRRLRAVDALCAITDTPAAPPGDDCSRKSGWLDLNRAHVLVEPHEEWKQMFDETWRLQREHFWTEDMSDVDWSLVHKRYSVLLPRINARSELSDLIWEMQGELGTSHAYEFGGDYRWPPGYYRGFLGAELAYDEDTDGYKIAKILRGDSWDEEADSPLAKPGAGIKVGDVITAVGGRPVSKGCSVDELLADCLRKDVMLTIRDKKGKSRNIAVKTLATESIVRYRDWVSANRKYVHEKTGGRIGYVHIPDMGPYGYAEFHRSYLSEIHRQGLIVDVRYNGGGHVSQLLLEKLRRKRVGYDISRWGMPMPYPVESVAGPLVAITNQFAGSDGDIFSHCFKLYGLGPLVGKRTWGGVIGISPRHYLVDGTITTQPEYSFWFTDTGWGVENHGADPDYNVDYAPQDYRLGRDPQMDKALDLILDSLKKKPFKLPKFDQRPSLPLPRLKKPISKR